MAVRKWKETVCDGGIILAQGSLGVVDAALVRWLMKHRREKNYLAVQVTQGVFGPVLPARHLEIFLSVLEPVDAVLQEGETPSTFFQQRQIDPNRVTVVTWPETELLDYSVARICKRCLLEESHLDMAKLTTASILQEHYGPRPQRRETIGLVSGSFDVIHPAHIHLMQTAKQSVDRLVVLTMSSASIQQQPKNRLGDRPIYNVCDRVEVLAALRAVDHVVVFDDLNCLPSLQVFCPDYFFKSAADLSRPIVRMEAELVTQLGGHTIYLKGLLGGYSSTAIIEHIREQAKG